MKAILKATIVAVLAVGVGTACVPLLIGGAAVGGYYVGKDERTAGEIADDAAIVTAVNTRFVRDDLVRARDINVDSFRRVVTLRGSVQSAEARRRAIELAEGAANVERVIADELVVR